MAFEFSGLAPQKNIELCMEGRFEMVVRRLCEGMEELERDSLPSDCYFGGGKQGSSFSPVAGR